MAKTKKKTTVKKKITAKKSAVKKAPAKKSVVKKPAAQKAAPKKLRSPASKATPSLAAGKSRTGKVMTALKNTFRRTVKKLTPNQVAATSAVLAIPDVLGVGNRAPDFSLPSDEGKTLSLKDFSGKTVVLYFYPKDDTPGCTQQSCDFRDSFSRVQARGAVVLGVSKDSVKSHQKFKSKFSLPFPLLSDESGRTIEAYRVWKEKSMYGKKYMGIDRTTYLIDVDAKGIGTIRKAYPKVKVTGHVAEILKDLA